MMTQAININNFTSRMTYHANTNSDISTQLQSTATYDNIIHTGSAKYSLVNTGQIVEYIKQHTNLVPVSYRESKSRKHDGIQAHMIRFRDKKDLDMNEYTTKSEIPELVLLNSYDKSKAFKLYYGIIRMSCLNGLITGTDIASFSHIHYKFDYVKLHNFLDKLPELTYNVNDIISVWKNKELSTAQRHEIALRGLMLRDYTNNSLVLKSEYRYLDLDLDRMTSPRRVSDKDNSLWTLFNIVQEKLINGARLATTSIRRVNAPSEIVKLNRSLWNIASEYTQ